MVVPRNLGLWHNHINHIHPFPLTGGLPTKVNQAAATYVMVVSPFRTVWEDRSLLI